MLIYIKGVMVMKTIKSNKSNLVIEIFNSITHGVGAIMGIVFLVLMIIKYVGMTSTSQLTGFIIYGSSFIFLFLASCLYHGIFNIKVKNILRIFDHSAIFLFIAGSYTPIVLRVLKGYTQLAFLILIWLIAIGGFIFKIVSYGKYDKYIRVSVFLYILMGWLSLMLIRPIVLNTNHMFLLLLVIGGILYTIGTFFYKKKLKAYNHLIWHIFVLAGAICHFIAIYKFLIN